ncbi:putative membrane protein [Pacificitalea manganoxidans]|nr:putative membrane protein [Pacificitalea manganoxidans]|tara:strand:- start:335 stop:454 length:120 start_codon:yes stop_codon:yes gene_type:complete
MMMHEQMGGGMMAAMAIFWVLGLIVLGLVIAALVKYLRN